MAIGETSVMRYFLALEQAVGQFNRRWPSCVERCEVYALPAYARNKQRMLVPDAIVPHTLTGQDAIARVRTALKQFKRDRDQNPLSVLRFPGFVSLRQSALDDIAIINELKKELQLVLQLLEPEEVARVRLTRRLLPNIAMIQVYRQIYVYDEPVQKIQFTWSQASHSTKKLDRDRAVDQLEVAKRLPPPPEFSDRAQWQPVLDREIQRLQEVDPTHLVVRRPVAPHPKVMVYFDDEYAQAGSRHDRMHTASLPVFVRDNGAMCVTALKTFVYDRHRLPQRAAHQYRWISRPLGIAVRTQVQAS